MSLGKTKSNRAEMKEEELKLYRSLVGPNDRSKPETVVSHYIENELAGIAGVVRRHGLPSFFVIVSPKHRRKGIGKKLIFETIKKIPQKYSFIILTTDNLVAKKMFEDAGFRKIYKNPKKTGMIYWFKPNFADKVLVFFIKLYKKYLSRT